MSIPSCYFYVIDVEKLWFWMCLRHISMLSHFCLFFKLCSGVFNNPVATPALGLLDLFVTRIFDYDLYWRTQACLLCIFVPSLTRALFTGPCHCLWIFVPFLTFRVHIAGNLNKTISFVVGVLSTLFPRALPGLVRYSPSGPMPLSIFLNIPVSHIRLNVFWSNWVA